MFITILYYEDNINRFHFSSAIEDTLAIQHLMADYPDCTMTTYDPHTGQGQLHFHNHYNDDFHIKFKMEELNSDHFFFDFYEDEYYDEETFLNS